SQASSFSSTPTRREDDDDRAGLHPIHEIDDVLVGHADAARRDGMADIFRLVGAVDAVQGVLVALVKVDRPRAQRIGRASGNALWVGAEPGLDLRRRDPIRPFSYVANRSDARPGQRFLTHRHAVAERLASRQDVIEKTRAGIDKDRARLLFASVVDN